jgi:multidrug efflux pump subunit AcrA (membrane-fusion protein)
VNPEKFDRTLLRAFFCFGGNFERIEPALLQATDAQLWGALACLHEPEFAKFHPLNLEPKIRAILEQREMLSAVQKYQAAQTALAQQQAQDRAAQQAKEAATEARNRRRWLTTTGIAIASFLVAVLKGCH